MAAQYVTPHPSLVQGLQKQVNDLTRELDERKAEVTNLRAMADDTSVKLLAANNEVIAANGARIALQADMVATLDLLQTERRRHREEVNILNGKLQAFMRLAEKISGMKLTQIKLIRQAEDLLK